MSTRSKIIGVIVLVIVSYAIGRYSAPQKIITKTDSSSQSIVDKDKDVDIHKETKTIVKPDGTKETDVVEDTNTHTNDEKETASSEKTEKEVIKSSSHLTVSALAGAQLTGITTASPVVYGVHVTKDVLGPVNIGAWGLDNRTVGLSVGLTF